MGHLRLRDLIGRSQLQYIDYKVEYGLRFNPNAATESGKYRPSIALTPQQKPVEPVPIVQKIGPPEEVQHKPEEVSEPHRNETLLMTAAGSENVPVQIVSTPKPPSRLDKTLTLFGQRLKNFMVNSLEPNTTESRIVQKLRSPLTIFSLFNVFKFQNGPCLAQRNRQLPSLQGVCYHEFECAQLGGVPMDLCAEGFGVCCVFQLGCNDQTSQNTSYFQSPGFPKGTSKKLICSFTIALSWNVRQVRLELLFFEMGAPTDGNCLEDQLIVSVQNSYRRYPVLCGINSGQHMYLQIEREYSHFVYLTATSNSNEPKAFNIRITQLADMEAPDGCLQYLSGVNGYIKSFNYEDQSVLVLKRVPSYYNNLNYAICIRRMPNFCSTTFSNVGENGEANEFQLVNFDEEGISLTKPDTAGVEIYSCPDDYLAINYLRLCGERLNDGSSTEDYMQNAPVMDDSAGPIVIPVRSDQEFVGRGFKLMFKQEVCNRA
ncbi:uncharacterized protein LOC129755553 isoform X2 [Uranotaenia lowii]|uniref:uncharacterized protein LOC129755553 isoform X2 n=1 Tax=Uranotaenia lowii TaxID=190385 RepID=UPI00247868A4|nr:uncharacterized protein LOC129755553 isoform X2 [Uranotaenia lowii]